MDTADIKENCQVYSVGDSKQSWELIGECSASLRKSCSVGGAHIMLLGMGYGKEGVEGSEKPTGLPPRGKS